MHCGNADHRGGAGLVVLVRGHGITSLADPGQGQEVTIDRAATEHHDKVNMEDAYPLGRCYYAWPPGSSVGAGDVQSTTDSTLHPFAAPPSCSSLLRRGSWALAPTGGRHVVCHTAGELKAFGDSRRGTPLLVVLHQKPSLSSL